MAELIDKGALIEELHHMIDGDAEFLEDYEYMGIDDCIRSMPTTTEAEIRNKAIEEFAERLKPIIDEKIKGWTNSDDLRRWCERAVNEIAEQMKGRE